MAAEFPTAPPAYVPPAYELRRTVVGKEAAAHGVGDSQIRFLYTRGWKPLDFVYSLSVSAAPPGAADLSGTKGRAGSALDISVPSASVVYHDGWWAPGPGVDSLQFPSGLVLHWERAAMHSLTIRTSKATFGIRGGKNFGVTLDELIKIARSLSY